MQWRLLHFCQKNKKIKLLYPYKKGSQKLQKCGKKYYSGASGLMGLNDKDKKQKFYN